MKSLVNPNFDIETTSFFVVEKGEKLEVPDKAPKDSRGYWTEIGSKVEAEHTPSKEEAAAIARDHLDEDKDYYRDWKNKEKILFQPKAPKLKNPVSNEGDAAKSQKQIQELYVKDWQKETPQEHAEWMSGKKIEKGKDGHVASVAVRHGSHILMGKRRDNDRWTLPGGHLDEGETKEQGAQRELKEEAGIEAKNLKHLKSEKVTTHTGKEKTIHAFVVDHDKKPKTTMKNDPDQEVHKWQWIDTKDGLPEDIKNNLHSPKNTTLKELGLLKSIFTIDLMKGSRPHKYLRKFKSPTTGEWIYVYHEGDNHGRQIPEEAVHHIKALAEAGDEHARKLHDTLEAHNEEKLKILRELHHRGDKAATKHLKTLGIDADQEKLEARVAAPPKDEYDEEPHDPAGQRGLQKMKDHVKAEVEASITHLRQHMSTPVAQRIMPTLTDADPERGLLAALNKAKTIREVLDATHKIAMRLDHAQTRDVPAQRPGSHKTYGNMIYNNALEKHASAGFIPREYAEHHKREAFNDAHKHEGKAEFEAKQAERQRQREEQERRELAELHGSAAHFLASAMRLGDTSRTVAKAREINQTLTRMFGRTLKKEDWPYQWDGLKVEYHNVSIGSNGMNFEMSIKDADGNTITDGWRRDWSMKDGRPHIYNSYLKVKPGMRGGAKVGEKINAAQRKLLKSAPRGGTMGVTANIDVGGYNWANTGFSFASTDTLRNYRSDFKRFLSGKGINLSDEDMQRFTEPAHFAAFTDGKKHVVDTASGRTNSPFTSDLTPQQIQSRSLTGVAGEYPLSDNEIRAGKTTRMVMPLGKQFLLGKSWSGIWDSNKDSIASKYGDAYINARERAYEVLGDQFKHLLSDVASGSRGRAQAQRTESVAPSTPSFNDRMSSHRERRSQILARMSNASARRHIENWLPINGGNIRMTESRIKRLLRNEPAAIEEFLRHAPLTRPTRNKINRMRLGLGGT